MSSADTNTGAESSEAPEEAAKVSVSVDGVGGGNAIAKASTSTQLADRRIRSLNVGVRPPYNPDWLASFLERNETHATAVRKKARYEVGYGFTIVPYRDRDPEEADEQQYELAWDFWRGHNSRWQTGPQQSAEPTTPEEVKELARQDYHNIGWCCLEILVDMEGHPIGLAHVPANTVRVRKPQTEFDQPRHPEEGTFVSSKNARLASRGYVQIRNGRRRYFGEAGDRYRGKEPVIVGGDGDDPPSVRYDDSDDDHEPIFVDQETGKVVEGSAETLDTAPANELIFIRNPNPLEQDYGVPDWVSATRTISADEAAKDYNREFFENDTIPRMVIKVTGGKLTEESRNDLEKMLDGLRAESHRAVILEVEKFLEENPLETQDGTSADISIEPLGQGISEDMDFKNFREKNEHEIAKVHEVPPILIGVTGTSNRSNSKEQVREFATDVIAPEQHKFAERLYRTIHQKALGITEWTIEYALRGADQPEKEARMTEQKVRSMRLSGVVTVDELREEQDLEPFGPPRGEMTLAEFEAEFQGGGDSDGGEETTAEALTAHTPPPEHKIGEREWSVVESRLATKDDVEQTQFNSSNLAEGLYDYEEQELYLSFHREDGQNSLYVYVNVPPTEWDALTNAGSHGGYHYDNIRLEYAYLEITNFHDRLPEGPTPAPEDIPEDTPV